MPGTPEHRPQTIIALDFGMRRIGIAVGQQVTNSASSIGVVANSDNGPDWQTLQRIVSEWQPARLIVGMPSPPDGKPSALTNRICEFMQDLRRFGVPVESTDEDFSSREAGELLRQQRMRGLRGRVSRENVDSTAAVLIAERWLSATGSATRHRKNQPEAS